MFQKNQAPWCWLLNVKSSPQSVLRNMSILCWVLSKWVTFLNFRLSQGSVATYCRWGGNFCDAYIENFLTNHLVKNFENRSIFAKVIIKHQGAWFFFGTRCILWTVLRIAGNKSAEKLVQNKDAATTVCLRLWTLTWSSRIQFPLRVNVSISRCQHHAEHQ